MKTHKCNWPGCDKRVRASLWGCPVHWFKVPLDLRAKLLRAYSPGQTVLSKEYMSAFSEIEQWIAANFPQAGKQQQEDHVH